MIDEERIREIASLTRLIQRQCLTPHAAKRVAILVARDANAMVADLMFGPAIPRVKELHAAHAIHECGRIARCFLTRARDREPVVDPMEMTRWLTMWLIDAETDEVTRRVVAKRLRKHAHRTLTSRWKVNAAAFALLVLSYRFSALWIVAVHAKQSPKRPPPKSDAERAELATRAPLVPLVPRTRFHWTGEVPPDTIIGG